MRIRTGYSFKTAVGSVQDVIARLKAIGATDAPMTDRASTFGFVEWTKATEKAGLRPVYGVELGVSPDRLQKKAVTDYWTFLAKDDLRSLHELVRLATKVDTESGFLNPLINYSDALGAPGLIKIAGERVQLDQLGEPREDTFVALSPSTPRGLFRAAKERGHRFIAVSDNAYPSASDREFYRVVLKGQDVQSYPQHILSPEEWARAVSFADQGSIAEALGNAAGALPRCAARLIKANLLKPEKKVTLRAMCEAGAAKLAVDLTASIYRDRLDKELRLIAEKDFEDYFYIIADVIAFAKEVMIVGPARGSSCGSLVCYLLGITAIDPLPHGLIFERFIDVNRSDLPDIDIDFSDTQRERVFEYVRDHYGKDHVARLGTVGTFQPRSALKLAAMGLRVPQWRIDKIMDNIIHRSSGDARAQQQLEDTLRDTEAGRALLADTPEIMIAARMEGHPSNASQHAAGIVITNEPIIKYVAIDSRTGSAMCNKKDAEYLNLLKIDALGLTQLSIFERCLEMIGVPPRSGWLEKLPLDDVAAFAVLNDGKFSGIFQFMGMALQSLSKQVKIDRFEDLVHITALARPGPLASGNANEWVRRRIGAVPISYPHPAFEAQLSDTLGVVMYQEQVMQIGREIGKLSWEDVTQLRKSMSKSLGKEYFDQYGDRWKAGARELGIPNATLNSVWDDLCAYGSWSFNKSHAVAYGLVSYWCCWLKAHHPVEFAAATLDAEVLPERQIQILRELKEEGIDYVPIDKAYSVDRWAVGVRDDRRILVGPLTSVKGIGPAKMKVILNHRVHRTELPDSLQKLLTNAKTDISSLYPVSDRIAEIIPDHVMAHLCVSKPLAIKDVQMGVLGDIVILGVVVRIAPRDDNEDMKVQKRGYRVSGEQSWALNMFVRDDTDEMFVRIDRYQYEELARPIIEHGRPGKALYMFKGSCPNDFRMLRVQRVLYLGDMDEDKETNPIITKLIDQSQQRAAE